MGIGLDNKELEAALDIIFKHLEEKGIKVEGTKKDEFKKQIAGDLYKKLTMDDIKNVDVQKKLLSCIVSLVMGKHDEYKEMISNLESDKKSTPDPKLEHRLTAQLMILTMLSNLLDPDKKKTSELKPDAFKRKILESENEKAKTPEDKQKLDAMSKQIDDCLRNLNGGINPTVNGGIEFPILGPIFGNLLGFTNQTVPDPNSLSEMVDAITFNTKKTDPMGLENNTVLRDMGEGIDMGSVRTPRNTPS